MKNRVTIIAIAVVVVALAASGCGKARTDACADACQHITELSLSELVEAGDPEFANEVKQTLARDDASRMSQGTGNRLCIQRCRAERLDTACVMKATTFAVAMSCPFRKPE